MEEQMDGINSQLNLKKNKIIILAGATGHLGQLINKYLVQYGATVKALVRSHTPPDKIQLLQNAGTEVIEVDYNNRQQLVNACKDGSCIVSALSGLRDVLIEVQTNLLTAAIETGVPRFIPSDYCIDFTKISYGKNRNLNLRKEFSEVIDASSIKATSILNGMFTDLLTGQAPVVLFKIKRVLYWGSSTQLLDFTTIDNTANYTAQAALDDSTPRYLPIAGEVINAKGLVDSAASVTGEKFSLLRPGGLSAFKFMIKATKFFSPGKNEIFPAWQGMQYMYDMFTGKPKLNPLDNKRYPVEWTSISQVLLSTNLK